MAVRQSGVKFREAAAGYLFLTPAVLLFLVLGASVLLYGFRLSFYEWNGLNPNWTPVGLDNYKQLLYSNPELASQMWASMLRTLYVTLALTIGIVVISLPIALALNAVRAFKAFLRTIFILPYVTAGIAVFFAWRFILLPDGSLNALLGQLHLTAFQRPDGFLGDPATSLAATTSVLIWSTVPLGILLYLAGLQSINQSVIDAARIDGANGTRMMRSIYWPLLRPVTALLVAVALRTSLHEFQVFLLMTNGGPLDRSRTASLFAYQFAFGTYSQYGLAAAMGWILFLVGLALSLATFALLRRKD